MDKKYNVKIKDTQDYISLYNGIFKLSATEIEILAEFVKIYKSLHSASVNINPFSTEMKKKVAKRLGRDNFNTLNNYIKSLCEKGAISKSIDGYKISNMLVPMNENSVIFKLNFQEDGENTSSRS